MKTLRFGSSGCCWSEFDIFPSLPSLRLLTCYAGMVGSSTIIENRSGILALNAVCISVYGFDMTSSGYGPAQHPLSILLWRTGDLDFSGKRSYSMISAAPSAMYMTPTQHAKGNGLAATARSWRSEEVSTCQC